MTSPGPGNAACRKAATMVGPGAARRSFRDERTQASHRSWQTRVPPRGRRRSACRCRRRSASGCASARERFHANDNIAAFIEPGELPQLQREVEAKLVEVLDSLVIDTESDHNTRETARRVAKMYLTEVFRGRYHAMPPITEFPNVERLNELMIVGPITVRSACSHHLCPIIGKLWVGVLPNEHSNLIGLSKYARIADWVMSRPQIQEEAVTRLADLLLEAPCSPTAWPSSWRPITSACSGAASRTPTRR